jgi:hypothetical protein
VILQAMKTYGMMVADNGSDWFFQGASDPRWDDDALDTYQGHHRQQLRSRADGAADDQLVDQAQRAKIDPRTPAPISPIGLLREAGAIFLLPAVIEM